MVQAPIHWTNRKFIYCSSTFPKLLRFLIIYIWNPMYLLLPMGGFWVRSFSSLAGPKCHIYTEPLPVATLNSHPPCDVPPLPISWLHLILPPLESRLPFSGFLESTLKLLSTPCRSASGLHCSFLPQNVAGFPSEVQFSHRAVWAPRGPIVNPTLPKWLFQKSFCFCYTLTTKELIQKPKEKTDNYVTNGLAPWNRCWL